MTPAGEPREYAAEQRACMLVSGKTTATVD